MKTLLATGLALAALSRVAAADVVRLANGDRLTGNVLEVADGKLTLDTDFAGTLKISWSKVEGVETDHDVRIRLEDDRVLVGRLVPAEKGILKVQEEGQPAPTELRKPEIAHLNEPGTVWHGRLNLSGKVETGNTDSTELVASAEVLRETENTRFLIRGNYGHETKQGAKTEDNYYVLGKFDRHVSHAAFAYLSDEVRRDRFEDLQYRNVASVGAGLLLWKLDSLEFSAEAGPSYTTEQLADGSQDHWFGARAAARVRLQLPFGLEIRDDFVYWPNFDVWENWQLHNELVLSTQIGEGWHLSFSIFTDVDNEPSESREEEDTKYVVGLGYRF